MGRGFFQSFEQCIESTDREHVHFIYDINSVFGFGRGKMSLLTQKANIIYTVIAGSVYFNNICNSTVINALAYCTFSAGVTVIGIKAVDGFGKYFGTSSFARTS